MTFVCQPARSAAPHTPRVVLIGPRGCGKSTQAALLADKYNLVDGKLAFSDHKVHIILRAIMVRVCTSFFPDSL